MKIFQFVIAGLAALSLVSAGDPEQDDVIPPSDVVVLTSDTHDAFIAEHPLTLVEYFAPWCPHCKSLAPEYASAAAELKELDPPISIASVDCTTENVICDKLSIQGFPTLKLFRSGVADDYKGERTAKSIVTTIKKQLLPAVSDVSPESFENFIISEKVVIVGFFDEKSAAERKIFTEIANVQRDSFLFGAADGSKTFKGHKHTTPSIALFKKFDEGLAVLSEDLTSENIKDFISKTSMPIMDEVGPDNYEFYVKRGLPIGFFFYGSAEQREQVGKVIEPVAKEFVGKISFVYLDSAKFGAHAPNLALKEEWPAFGFQDGLRKWPLDQSKPITEEAVRALAKGVLDGSIASTLKSEPVPETQDEPVITVVGDSFDKIVLDTKKDVLLELYAPWCGHCKKLVPTWDTLAKTITSDKIVIAKMDGTTNDIPPSTKVDLQGFPTILLFKAGSSEFMTYQGDRSLASLSAFLKENAVHGSEVPEIDDSAEQDPDLLHEELDLEELEPEVERDEL
ncbi:hypothetical protein BATDEDRAFT_35223 [Batrachochytrium dendrobatidis JAM81]|uniref:Protein disulfide-isomerase n=2 Tax=Batrachochytrium dendrobatidis TaxID=109871 RepID=F4P4C2_BATDJ|nr:uncharacterized protein BATDEDRAFT_35223 [Batrachochytrium dendrobatidis JAM81]EGF79896.1 hypothetical protein BATDEDRAFT_35223 [Batrachochytrium dendrobatidis JAM81]KAJ8323389.1 protein disulfide-isomerase precursor [Batrachochytrium dendrobatidis]KAK5673095.1 protein disulfide-isomerase precursor [Batrachochytrium dendrobatidis]|eukprot:XP_006679545.1 hypothetical protein BATDEDRAFT_35223 [Batrachochytrium dendrobatidis JAM81]